MNDIPNVKYAYCEYCKTWYRDDMTHNICGPGGCGYVNPGAPVVTVSSSFSPDYAALFATLLERIAVALERLAEK